MQVDNKVLPNGAFLSEGAEKAAEFLDDLDFVDEGLAGGRWDPENVDFLPLSVDFIKAGREVFLTDRIKRDHSVFFLLFPNQIEDFKEGAIGKFGEEGPVFFIVEEELIPNRLAF